MIKLHSVYPPASEAKFVGDEPVWDNVEITEKNYKSEILRGLNWHGYCATDKNYKKYLEEWIKANKPTDAKKFIASLRTLKKANPTISSLARISMRNFPLSEKDVLRIEDYLNSLQTKKKRVVKTDTNRPSVQDAMKNQLSEIFSEIDHLVDVSFKEGCASAKSMVNVIFRNGENIKAPHIRLIINYIQETYLNEWQTAYDGSDEQLSEGYNFMSKRTFKSIINEFNQLIDLLSRQATAAKTQRIRKKKPLDKKKMVSKLRFMDSFDELNLKSQDAVNIIGSNLVWVYDTKRRKLGYYEAEVKDSIYAKGTTIYGYKNSCEKILRKPETQLEEFMKLRKNQTKNWFDTINSKCTEMKGRTNANIILVRID